MTGSVVGFDSTAEGKLRANLDQTNVNTFIKNASGFLQSHHGGDSDKRVQDFLDALKRRHFSDASKLAAGLDAETRRALGLAGRISGVDTDTADKVNQLGNKIENSKTAGVSGKPGGAPSVGKFNLGNTTGTSKNGFSSGVNTTRGYPSVPVFSSTGSGFGSHGTPVSSFAPPSGGSGFSNAYSGGYSDDGGGSFLPTDAVEFEGFSSDETDRGVRWLEFANSVAGVYQYVWGGGSVHGPTQGVRDGGVADSYGDYNNVGFDCSGLAMYGMYVVEGVVLPRSSQAQYSVGTPVSRVFPGCLGFCEFDGSGPNHVVIAIDDDTILQAPHSGAMVSLDSANLGAYIWRAYVDV